MVGRGVDERLGRGVVERLVEGVEGVGTVEREDADPAVVVDAQHGRAIYANPVTRREPGAATMGPVGHTAYKHRPSGGRHTGGVT